MKKKWIISLSILAIVILGWILAGLGGGIKVKTAEVKQDSITKYVEERATTTLPSMCRITMPQEGRILPITLQEGDPIKAGDVLVRLDDNDWNTASKEAEMIVAAMKDALVAAEAQTKASSARQDYADWLQQTKEKLFASHAGSEMAARDAKKDALSAEVDYDKDQAIYHMMDALNAIARLVPVYVNRRVERTTVRSPIDGIVLVRHVKDEQVLQPGTPIMDVGDISKLEITADILSEQAAEIKAGDSVDIFGEVLGPTVIKGTVKRVNPSGFTKLSSLGVEQQRVAVIISINNDGLKALKDKGRKIGVHYQLRVRVHTTKKDAVLVVPRISLFRGNSGAWSLFVVKDRRAVLSEVETGIMNDTSAEIIKGLSEGDVVILAPQPDMKNNTKVS